MKPNVSLFALQSSSINDFWFIVVSWNIFPEVSIVICIWNLSAWIWNIRDHIKISLYGQKSCVKEIKTVDGIVFIYYAWGKILQFSECVRFWVA